MTEIRLEKIEKSFGSVKVLKGIDLIIRRGEFFTFLGPSGCGKSTLLNIIAGLEEATSGSVLFDGRAVDRLGPAERDVAFVFQSYALYPHMSVFENIAFPLRVRGLKDKEVAREVGRTAELLGLGQLLKRLPRELSGGQRQRVALGRAIVRRPKVFLMDEPLSNLDARLRVETRGELKKLHRELGITTVYVTHDQEEAMSLSDRVAVLFKGEIQQTAPPMELFLRPQNTFVAGFIGSPSMNIFEAVVSKDRGIEAGGMRFSAGRRVDLKAGRVLAGIRPEDIVVKKGDSGFEAVVDVVEPMGSVLWVEVLSGGVRLRARAGPDESIAPGDKVRISFDTSKVHLFDPDTERRLS